MSPHAKFGLDRPSRSAGHRQQTDKHIAFYMLDQPLAVTLEYGIGPRFNALWKKMIKYQRGHDY